MKRFPVGVKIFLVGLTLGGLMGISIRYPVRHAAIEDAKKVCKENNDIKKVTVGISGKIYVIECNDGKVFRM